MRVFLDTNVLLATILEDAERVDESTQLLDRSDLEFVTSAVNVMELRAVLTKKRGLERDDCEGIVRDVVADVDVYLPDSGDLADAVELQRDTLLYPMDAQILAFARAVDATLVSFDSELLDHGAVTPSAVE